MYPTKEFLLVAPDIEQYSGVKIGDVKIESVKVYNEGQHEVVSGTIAAIPAFEKEFLVGDEIIFHYRDYPYALDDKRLDGRGNFFIRRCDPFLIIRGEEEIAVNDTVIVEPVIEVIDTIVELPDHIKAKKSLTKGVVRVSAYSKKHDVYNKYLKPGVEIFFDKVDSIPLQTEMYQKIANKATLYRMKHDDVLAIIPLK